MRHKAQGGFTLIELMVVVIIIGIFSALAIPGIMEVNHRNALTDTTARFRTAGAAIRDLSVQTQRAVVLEVSSNRAWINILAGPNCWAPTIAQRCVPPLGDDFNIVKPGSTADNAGVSMCEGAIFAFSPGTTTCTSQTLTAAVGGGGALCYSGAGELWLRDSSDGNTDCDAEGDATAVETDWVQGCSAAPSSFDLAGSTTMLEDGAAISFNRYGDNTPCSNGSEEGIARFVMFPSNGMPYSKLPNQ